MSRCPFVWVPECELPGLQGYSRKDRESAFIACSFWMVQNLMGAGRRNGAERLFEKLISQRNDVGLLSEEYDPDHGRFMGNFPASPISYRTHQRCQDAGLPVGFRRGCPVTLHHKESRPSTIFCWRTCCRCMGQAMPDTSGFPILC